MELLFIQSNIYNHLAIAVLFFVVKVLGEDHRIPLIPRFIQSGDNYIDVHKGDTAVLRCTIENLGPKSVAWRKIPEVYPLTVGKMMYAPNEDMSIDYHERDTITSINLIIKQANPSHSGTYECQISASTVYTYHVNLTVRKEPRIQKATIDLKGQQYLNAFQRLNLTCNATGELRAPEAIDWFFDGNFIDIRKKNWKDRTLITNYKPEVPSRTLISQLTIERVQFEDAGIYVCRSSQPSINTDVETTSLNVHVLGGDNVTKTKREGEPQFNSKHYSDGNNSTTINGCCFFLMMIILFQAFS